MNLSDSALGMFLGFVVGIFAGGWCGYLMFEDIAHDFDTQETLRAECVKGNDRACRMYEVDYGR